MPFYEFERCGQTTLAKARVEDLPALTERMAAGGWQRAFSLPHVIVYPTYSEAVEEVTDDVAAEDRRRALAKVDAAGDVQRELRRAHQKEDWDE